MRERVIIKLGGSVLSPHDSSEQKIHAGDIPFDFAYANRLLQLLKESKQDFVLVIGGGFLNRWYLRGIGEYKNDDVQEDLHRLGMAASNINALLFRLVAVDVLGNSAVYPQVIKYDDYSNLDKLKKELKSRKIVIAAGWKPGHSHDVDALMFASLFATNQVLSFKNVDGIYSADPNKDSSAIKKKVLTWAEYKAIIHTDIHSPGASYPIDPVAAKLAEKAHIGFTVIDGRDFDAVEEAIKTKLASKGSVITP